MTNTKLPRFLLNSIPKSGTHLLKQLLLGVPGMQNDPFIGMYGHFHYQTEEKLATARAFPNHSFLNGHFHYSKEWETFFEDLKLKQIFVLRDPRDVLISYAHFIPKVPAHHLYETFMQEGFTHNDRIQFLIEGGVPITPFVAVQPHFAEWYQSFSEWMGRPNVHSVRFEDLMSSEEKRRKATGEIIDFLWGDIAHSYNREELITKMTANIKPQESVTFRKGKIGSWREELNGELEALFIKQAGQLLDELGYER
ncbi:sulfotransferase domain-containing protein [Guptibacillus hwajinpoensis]|uniref:sulfotransferase domain-containing protein n=1 Tax=Guptibacillus hwajinpoensis TaxID=208199 RepID=UPI0024B36299|nr:sulfotransferase domain-containing protein [Pseudalkalibacillus hwajinpoensis]